MGARSARRDSGTRGIKRMAESEIEQIGAADVVVGLVPPPQEASVRDGLSYDMQIEAAIGRIVESTPPVRAVLMHPPFSRNGSEAPQPGQQWRLLPHSQLAQNPAALAQSLGDSFRAVFEATRKLGARACAVITSDLSTVTADWTALLLQPVLEGHYDLVAPCYARHAFEGMINRAILYPLVRALYGKQIRNPLGPDFGMSAGL